MRDTNFQLGASAVESVLRHRGLIALVTLFFLFSGTALSFLIKPRFKASGTISISPLYFQSPITRAFMPEISDSGERKAQREVLIQKALDVEFLNSVTTPTSGETPLEAAQRRFQFSKSVEVIPMQPGAYQISAVLGTREESLALVNRALASIEATLHQERLSELTVLRDTIAMQLRQMLIESSPDGSSFQGISAASTSELEKQRESLQQEIQDQLQVFSAEHPAIKSMTTRLAVIKQKLAEQKKRSAPTTARIRINAAASFDDKDPVKVIYEDLMQKYEYINIVLALEAAPYSAYVSIVKQPELPVLAMSPNRPLIIFWSALAGLLFSLLAAVARDWLSVRRTAGADSDLKAPRPRFKNELDLGPSH
jgi:uncharacterized protein involved in exopolysaccharide biosynthesis